MKFVQFVTYTGVCGDSRVLPYYLLVAAVLLLLAIVGRKARVV